MESPRKRRTEEPEDNFMRQASGEENWWDGDINVINNENSGNSGNSGNIRGNNNNNNRENNIIN